MELKQQLVATGLNPAQAGAYLLLLKEGRVSPPLAARQLKLSRTNAYKLLDRLCELGLAKRTDLERKIVYEPRNPMALSNIVAEQRNIASRREDAVKEILGQLMEKYHTKSEQPDIEVVTGKQAVIDAYRKQIQQLKPIYFIRSRSDIPVMGYDVMHEIRMMPASHKVKRFGITPDLATGVSRSKGDQRGNLDRTWVRQEDYESPVEWSVSGSSVLIILFGVEPHAITITNPLIADSFKQLWQLLNNCLKAMSYYKTLPRHTKEA